MTEEESSVSNNDKVEVGMEKKETKKSTNSKYSKQSNQ